MASSDNVLRGGLTSKHVDVEELLAVLDFTPTSAERTVPVEGAAGERRFECPVEEFELAVLEVAPGQPFASAERRSIEMLLCRRGHASLKHHGSATGLDLVQGQSVVVPATAPRYAITGEAAFCRARVPEAPLLPSSDPAQRVSHGVV